MGAHRYWVMLAPSRSATETAAAARRAEELGLEGVFSIQLASNPFVPLAAAAVSTHSLRLGTGIALAFTRSPLETAFTALDLDHLSEGRFTLGLGSSVRWWHEALYGADYDPPVARLAEATRIIKLVVSGQARTHGRFDGDFWQLDLSRLGPQGAVATRPAGVGGGAAHPAGEGGRRGGRRPHRPSVVVAGVGAASRSRARSPTALARSGRERSAVEVNLWHVVAPNPDRAESVHDAKRHVAGYASIAQYESYYAAHGFGAEARRLQEAVGRRRPEGGRPRARRHGPRLRGLRHAR